MKKLIDKVGGDTGRWHHWRQRHSLSPPAWPTRRLGAPCLSATLFQSGAHIGCCETAMQGVIDDRVGVAWGGCGEGP